MWSSRLASPIVVMTAGAAAIAVLLIAIAMLSHGRTDPAPTTALVEPRAPVPADLVDGLALGRADAPVVLEVYGDYQCPVCGRYARDYLPRLVSDLVAPGTLRIVDRPIAFLGTGDPDESVDAAVGAACAARQDRYWDFHDLMMWNQSGENRGAFSRTRLFAMADRIGLDRAAFDACFGDPSVARSVGLETNAATSAGIASTPTFVVNGQRVVGLVAYEDLAGLIRGLAQASPAS